MASEASKGRDGDASSCGRVRQCSPAASCEFPFSPLYSELFFSFVAIDPVFLFSVQELGRAYVEVSMMPPPMDAAGGTDQGIAAGMGESSALGFVMGFSTDGPRYVDYVPWAVPRSF